MVAQDGRISDTEDDVIGLDTRVDDLESVNITGTFHIRFHPKVIQL